jgi:hypothetical protein
MDLAQTAGRKRRWGRAQKAAGVLSIRPLQPFGGGLRGGNSALHHRRLGDRQQPKRRGGGEKSRGGERATQKDVKNEGRSDYIYENKDADDNLPDPKDDISTQLHDILQRSTRILQKRSAFLSLFEGWGTYPSLPNVETPVPG